MAVKDVKVVERLQMNLDKYAERRRMRRALGEIFPRRC